MPNKKPQFVLRAEKEIFEKIKHIANENDRSQNEEIIHLIKKRIKEYEDIHGKIEINTNESK